MIRTIIKRVSPLFVMSFVLGAAGCPAEQKPAVPPPVHEDDTKRVDAAEAQLKAAETNGWGAADEQAFSRNLYSLSLKTRVQLQQRLARAITFGQIKVRQPPPPPPNAPACPCGGDACGAVATTQQPPLTNVPGKRVRKAAE